MKKKIFGVILAAAILLAGAAPGAAAAPGDFTITYTHPHLPFTLQCPAGWDGLCEIMEYRDAVDFYNGRNYDAGWGGFLFGIFVTNEAEPPHASFRELARVGGTYYFAVFPTDVQYNYENASLTNEYRAMYDEVDGILASFRLTVAVPTAFTARPTMSTVLVNGVNVPFDAYNIEGNNYFKLRDIAYVLSGTNKQFEVVWDGAGNVIRLTSGQRYTVIGGEMTGKGAGNKSATATNSKVYLDGWEVRLTAFNIEGNNYFRLRDIGAAVGFSVVWDKARNTIIVDTSKWYTPE